VTLLTHWEGEPIGVLAGLWGVPHVEAHDRIGSTNDRLKVLAAGGAPAFTVVLADAQSAGRGRSGARWYDAPGRSLLVSVLLPSDGGVPLHLPLLVGLAVARAVERAAAGLEARVKWPNDIMVAGRKAGGVLCEATRAGVVAGVGLNVRQRPEEFPEEVRARAVSLEMSAEARVSRSKLAGALVGELLALFRERGRAELPSRVHEELNARDALLGCAVETVQEGPGTARGIALDGALLLERPDGSRVRVVAGSVRVV
jgi:BirA family biotin operon repressor/biotin-[acetyl-CoA-carboxylase] ligase